LIIGDGVCEATPALANATTDADNMGFARGALASSFRSGATWTSARWKSALVQFAQLAENRPQRPSFARGTAFSIAAWTLWCRLMRDARWNFRKQAS